jgi:hypothetical protein
LEAAFRGRRLRGVEVGVPAGYSGARSTCSLNDSIHFLLNFVTLKNQILFWEATDANLSLLRHQVLFFARMNTIHHHQGDTKRITRIMEEIQMKAAQPERGLCMPSLIRSHIGRDNHSH